MDAVQKTVFLPVEKTEWLPVGLPVIPVAEFPAVEIKLQNLHGIVLVPSFREYSGWKQQFHNRESIV